MRYARPAVWCVTAGVLVPATSCRDRGDEPPRARVRATAVSGPQTGPLPRPSVSSAPRARAAPARGDSGSVTAAPEDPVRLESGDRPTAVLMTAVWCQWCEAFKAEVLPLADVQQALAPFRFMVADVDRAPLWMDLQGVAGLPSLAFFDMSGRHVLTRSGFLSAPEAVLLLEAVQAKLVDGSLLPNPDPAPVPALAAQSLSKEAARAELARLERQIFLYVNSNDGGFRTPARVPYPDLLRELQAYISLGAPKRVESWVQRTIESALRGRSPRLDGQPLPDLAFSAEELKRLARQGSHGGPRWREGIDCLPDQDPFLGIQDPIDHGVFRYAAGAGWYHPHFERGVLDNLSWALLLKARGDARRAAQILRFVEHTFSQGSLLGAVQKANPFYYRLRAAERRGIPAPPVARLWLPAVQARAARALPARCKQLLRVSDDRWPRAMWSERGELDEAADAPPDAVGELLLGLAACPTKAHADRAKALAARVVDTWQRGALPVGSAPARLFRLAAGLCAAAPGVPCGRALATVRGLPVSLEHAPPLEALARFGAGESPSRSARSLSARSDCF